MTRIRNDSWLRRFAKIRQNSFLRRHYHELMELPFEEREEAAVRLWEIDKLERSF